MPDKQNEAVSVCIARAPGADDDRKSDLLATCLEKSGLLDALDRCMKTSGLQRDSLKILILPDMEHYRLGSCTGTDPELVEHLVDFLVDSGYRQVAVAAASDPAASWLENREGCVLADLVGYRFETPRGYPYECHDLREETSPATFHPQSILHGGECGTAWLEADFRIVFAKNKSHESSVFALGSELVARVLPAGDEAIAQQRAEALVDFLRQYPPQFSIIDGWVSCHGSLGSLQPRPLETRVFVASADLLLCDWTAALLMGLDPYLNPLNALALRQIGLPSRYRFAGDLTPFENWQAPVLYQREAAAERSRNPTADRLAKSWLVDVDVDLFPFRHLLDSRANEVLKPWLREVDAQPETGILVTGLNYLLGYLDRWRRTWQLLYEKDKLVRRPSSLGFDPAGYSASDYDAVDDYITPLEQVVARTPPDRNGLRWRYLDGSVLFQYSRVIEVPFEQFVARADVAKAVTYMYDNLGGKRVTVTTDEEGRVRHQAERDIYLPQPNWLALFGGSYIDVGKIETVCYEADRHSISWRTVVSANESATYDDGKVSFVRHPGGTQVVIVARQEFQLPLFWQVVNLDRVPAIKDAVVSDAYVSFFSRTMANLEAVTEGRDPRVGRAPAQSGYPDTEHPLAVEQVKELLSFVEPLIRPGGQPRGARGEEQQDELGYRHFKAPRPDDHNDPLQQLAREFGAALAKDFRSLPNPIREP